MSGTLGLVLALLALGVPAALFALWPLRRGGGGLLLTPPADPREAHEDAKRAALRALRELDFEHAAGHISDEDHVALRGRYEAEAAAALDALDRLGPVPEPAPAPAAPAGAPARAGAWRHPVALGVGAVALLVLGGAIGAGIVQHTAPDPTAGRPQPGSRPLAALDAPGAADAPRPLAPEVLQGMLGAARQSLVAGRYSEAIAAYQAVLKRDPRNVDAMTHLGFMLALAARAGDHGPEMSSHAVELLDRALAIDPDYLPALLYHGQVLYELKQDVPGAIRSWEKFVAAAPPGEDRDRVSAMLAEARARVTSPPASR